MKKLIVRFASGVEELHLLNQKTFCRISVTGRQQPFALSGVDRFPLVNSQLFVPILLCVASPIELQQTLNLCYKTFIYYTASTLQGLHRSKHVIGKAFV